MKTSTSRILTTHVGSIPRPESLTTLLRARLGGQAIDETQLAARIDEAVAEVVRRQAETGLDVISDGEMGKASFLAYADERLTGFVTLITSVGAAGRDRISTTSASGTSWTWCCVSTPRAIRWKRPPPAMRMSGGCGKR